MSTHITLLVDNEVTSPQLTAAWGFSALVERRDEEGDARVLFDVGWDGDLLLDNAAALGIDLEGLDALVLSHEHWDHAGGLPRLLRALERPPRRVVVPTSLSRRQRLEIANRGGVEVLLGTPGASVAPGIRSTGTLPSPEGQPPEQALLIDGPRGPVLLTGCAHPGVSALLRAAEEPVVGLIGGLHDHSDMALLAGLDPLIPAHCTQHKQLVLESFSSATAAAAGLRVQL